LFVAFGVTGVQDMAVSYGQPGARIESRSPRILTSGPPSGRRRFRTIRTSATDARTADQARQAFDQLYKMNVDFIKILSRLPRDAYFALAEQARHWDLRMIGHIPSSVTAQEAVERGRKAWNTCSASPSPSRPRPMG